MSVKTIIMRALKTLVLALVFLVVFIAGGLVFPMQTAPLPPGQMPAVYMGIVVVALVNAVVLALVIGWSGWRGWRLVIGLGVAYYGVRTVMAQIETWYFAPAMVGIDRSIIPPLMARDLLVTLVVVPLGVWLFGRIRGEAVAAEPVRMTAGQWVWKLAAIAVVYEILYLGFGFFVAWSNPALTAMYGGGKNQEVFAMSHLMPFQIARGVLWAAFSLPVIRMTRARPWLGAVILGLFLALPMNIGHVIPNTVMPDPTVRLSHFIETSTSNFLFGLVVFWLLHRAHTSPGDLLGRPHPDASHTVAHA